MNAYRKLIDKHQEEINNFPMFFAFNNKQFAEGMRSLGLEPEATGAVYRLGHTGGFYRKSDAGKLHDMFQRHTEEMQAAIDADETGEGFIYDMFSYELANHEYSYTRDVSDTLDCLGLTEEQVKADSRMRSALAKARREQARLDW